ncbi:MAG TPA: T9SS type A sorting domain-containing protein [Candidatus Kapabacteria bacterium]|nr:T9SS type A sorting domain-containing protein [Candidatus Kapabacteria bacterium]
MKSILLTLFFVAATIPATAQWNSIDLGAQITTYCVKDSFLFMAAGNNHIYRYTVANGYSYADNGIDFSQGSVTSFASLGRYLFIGMTYSNGTAGPTYYSTNEGSQWIDGVTAGPVSSNGMYLFATYVGPNQIVRSEDTGQNWTVLLNLSVNSFASIGKYIFANTGTALWRSTDTGNHWTQLSPLVVGTMTTMDSLLFIVGSGKLIVSSDKGGSWNPITVGSGTVPETVTNLATDGKNLFITGQNSVTHYGNGVYLSTDIGKTWRSENQGLGYLNVLSLGVFDTLLFVNAAANINYYSAMRSIPEMVADTGPASVVEQLPPGDTVEVYPNPASGMVTIRSGGTSILGVQVLNVLGVDVLDMSNLRESDFTLDLSKLPSGTYFLRFSQNGYVQTRQISIEH